MNIQHTKHLTSASLSTGYVSHCVL